MGAFNSKPPSPLKLSDEVIIDFDIISKTYSCRDEIPVMWCYHLIFHKLIWFLSVSGDLSGKNVSSANHGARQYFATTTKNPRSAPACLWRQDWNLLINLNQISQNMLATSHGKTVLTTWFHSLVIKSTTIFTDCFLQKVADILNTEYSLKCWHQMLKR